MKSYRICTNTACLNVIPPKAIKPAEGPDKDEENAKLAVIDANMHCPKCNAKLTKFIHKVLDAVKARDDAEDILKQFGVSDIKKAEEAQAKYKAAKKETEAQAEKDIVKARETPEGKALKELIQKLEPATKR